MEQDKIKKLEKVGFTWRKFKKVPFRYKEQLGREESFNKGLEETLRYKEQHGTANAPLNYETSDGFNLGTWQDIQRNKLRKGKLEQDKIKKLEDIGFVWDLAESFNQGFEETLQYKEQHGTAIAPLIYKSPDGFNLGTWQDRQRNKFRKGKLEQDKIKKLEDIGFVWDIQEGSFNQGFAETLRYKNQHGIANTPARYETPEGFPLGVWQCRQRTNFKRGKLERDKIKKLEEIGFVWRQAT